MNKQKSEQAIADIRPHKSIRNEAKKRFNFQKARQNFSTSPGLMRALEDIFIEGFKQGYHQGYKIGEKEGYARGLGDGSAKGGPVGL